MNETPVNAKPVNATIMKFGYPDTLICEWTQWLLLLRPAQVTLGSCILAAKSDATAFGSLAPAAYTELAVVTAEIEKALTRAVGYDKINYLMLMMVDPHVHFHIIPRYEGVRDLAGMNLPDAGWPGPPALAGAVKPDAAMSARLRDRLKGHFGPAAG